MSRTVDLRKKNELSAQAQAEKKEEITPLVEKVFLVEQETPSIPNPPPEKANRFEWEAPSFYHNPQKKYLALIVIVLLSGAGAMIFYRLDTLTAIMLILSSAVLVLYANKKPAKSKVLVNQAGITIDEKTYYYKDLKSFWLDYDPDGPKELSLEANKWYMPYIKISIEDQNPVELRSLMINFIAEKEHQKTLTDLIIRKIGL